jgi:hypothetical protein
MGGKFRRNLAIGVLAVLAISPLAIQSASADGSLYQFDYLVNATTTLKNLNQTITVPQGTFKGSIDFGTGALLGDIKLPPATFTLSEIGIGLVTATAKIVPVGHVTGMVDFNTFDVTATSKFNIRIIDAHVNGTTKNLVGNYCRTATPISVTMTGPASLGGDSTFSGSFVMPKLVYCGVVQTTALNLLLPGPGNTFTAVASPAD